MNAFLEHVCMRPIYVRVVFPKIYLQVYDLIFCNLWSSFFDV
jgi:hypothetical protein